MPLGVIDAEVPHTVVLRNISPSPYIVRHLHRSYTILPDSELHLPWEAAQSFLGDPRAVDVGRNKFRRVLYDQCRALNNFCLGFDTETEAEAVAARARGRIDTSSWEVKKPPIEVYTIDGQRIYMLVDDPDGNLPNPWGSISATPDTSNTDVLMREIARMQEQMRNMERILAQRQTTDLPSQLASESPTPPVTIPPLGDYTGPQVAPQNATGRPPTMEDGIRTDFLPQTNASLPTPDQLFTDDDSTAVASSIPTPDPSTATTTKDSPRSTKPVARPRSR